MSVHWSAESMKWEYRELHATAMSVDYTGNNVLLAGRRWLAIKQINVEDSAEDVIKKYPRHSKYDAAGAEWCQTYHGQKLCAIASNQRVDVYEWRGGTELTCICSLKGHTRVVSDTHFHRQDHNLIATCSIDTFTHLWDLRDSRKPIVSLCAVAGASQVQWNKVSTHLVATAHDGDIKIWDYRKHTTPVHYISAHLCKIHGVDWSPHHEYQLVTSSHDGSIKYFDINNARRPENTIMTNFPVWRAIYTPFGSGLLTVGVGWGGLPRAEQAGVIGIWVGGTLAHRLAGHSDTVQTMVWRQSAAPACYQLVTWGRDQTLRVWTMHPSLLKMCSHYLPDDAEPEDDAKSDTISYESNLGSSNDLSFNDSKGQDMQMSKMASANTSIDEEFESIKDIAGVELVESSAEARSCHVRCERNGYVAHVQVAFPKNAPDHNIPKVSWLSGTNVDSATTIKILQSVNKTAYRKKREGQKCLLHCLKTLATCMDEIPVKSSTDGEAARCSQRSASEGEGAGDAAVPFPRCCGARWGAVATLVVFARPPHARRLSLKQESGTPRSLTSMSIASAFGAYGAASPLVAPSPTRAPAFPAAFRHPAHSITTSYFQDRWKVGARRAGRARGAARVQLCDASALLPLSRALAHRYRLQPERPVEMCEYNERVAVELGEAAHARAWALAAAAARALRARSAESLHSSEESAGWTQHALGAPLLHFLISHFAKSCDVQMAAMLAGAFAVFDAAEGCGSQGSASSSSFAGETSPYSSAQQLSPPSAEGAPPPPPPPRPEPGPCAALDDRTAHLYNCFKRVYADILHRWQLIYLRTAVMKPVGRCAAAAACGGRAAMRCAVCALPVRGLAAACPRCAHAGHADHLRVWFSQYESCPSGCGCKCVLEGAALWKPAAKF